MAELIKEERYIIFLGATEYVLRVQELIKGSSLWPARFRIHVAAASSRAGRKFYGATAQEAVERATEYLSLAVHEALPRPLGLQVLN
jgi:hypothetical protein